jgi:hypothetical protein
MTIDLSEYLVNYSTDDFKLKFSNLQPVVVSVKNLFEQYKVLDTYKRDAASFIQYRTQDNERIENISQKFYNTPDFWWIVCVFNNIRNPFFDLPLSEVQILELSDRLANEEGKYPKPVYYKLVFDANETKRAINIPKESFIADIVWDYREAMIRDGITGA